jgi:hypothetical protein
MFISRYQSWKHLYVLSLFAHAPRVCVGQRAGPGWPGSVHSHAVTATGSGHGSRGGGGKLDLINQIPYNSRRKV